MRPYDSKQHPYFLGVTLVLILINFAVFLQEPPANDQIDAALFAAKYAFIPDQLHAALNSGNPATANEYSPGFAHVFMTMIASMFIHASWLHIIGNMTVLIFIGPRVEGRMGAISYPILYFVSGIFGFLVTYVTGPTSLVPNVGASGAISGVIGTALFTDPRAWVWVDLIPVRLWFFAPIFILTELWEVFKAPPGDSTAHWAHVGGILVGLVTGFFVVSNKAAPAPLPATPHTATPPPKPITAARAVAPLLVAPPPAAATTLHSPKIQHIGAPASPHAPISPRTEHEAKVNAVAAHRIGSRVKVSRWVILSVSTLVFVLTAVSGGFFHGLFTGLFTFFLIFGVWTGCEHLFAYLQVHTRTRAPAAKPS